MNRFLLGALLVFAAPVGAQEAPVPTLQTSPQTLLTPEFIRSVQYIGAGSFDLKTQGEETFGTFAHVPNEPDYDYFKGSDNLRFIGLLFPPELRDQVGKKIIAFVQFDGVAKRGRIVGYLPATDANTARVKELVAQNPTLEFRFSSDKKVYAVGEPITVRLEIKNVSGAPLSIYTGGTATQYNFHFGGGSTTPDSADRNRPAIKTLAPGESWTGEQTYKGPIPVGNLGLSYSYDASDVLKANRALPANLFFERKRDRIDVEVSPADAGQKEQLVTRLKSPRWDEQLDAAQKMLLSDDPADWKVLEPFATHPYEALRRIAGQALFKGGPFSPALKQLLYGGTYLETYRARGEQADMDLALLARASVLDEAYKRGFLLRTPGYSPLTSVRDPRVGDLVASRLQGDDPMQGGANNGAILNGLSGTREAVEKADKPLSPESTAKVLEAWKGKRASVAKPFTQTQLDAEIALARKVGYDDFKIGPYYDKMVHYVDEGRKNAFGNAQQDVLDAELMALPPEAAPDLMRVLEWRDVPSPPDAALQFLAKSGDPKAFVFLAKLAYDATGPNGDARAEAVRLMGEMDYARAKVHIEGFFAHPNGKRSWSHEAPRLGAALALAAHGEKRAVPMIFSDDFKERLSFLSSESRASLEGVTGQKFPNWTQWMRWWEREGSKQEWT